MKNRILVLLLAIASAQAFGIDLKRSRNRTSGGKGCFQVNASGTMYDALCLDPTNGGMVDLAGSFSGPNYLTTSGIRFQPGAASNNLQMNAVGNGILNSFISSNTNDTGSSPMLRIDGRVITNSSTAADVSVRPLLTITNNGAVKVQVPAAQAGGGGITVGTSTVGVGFYIATGTSTTSTCSSLCSSSAANNGFNTTAPQCLYAWNSSGTNRTCSDATSETKRCVCFGMN
jgi:hypothetical protein